jgi:hypothetical protein
MLPQLGHPECHFGKFITHYRSTTYKDTLFRGEHTQETACTLEPSLRCPRLYPRRSVSSVISGGQFKRTGRPTVPKPGFVYRDRFPM